MKTYKKIVILASTILLLTAGCQNKAVAPVQPAEQVFNGTTVTVQMNKGIFNPDSITVSKGTKVVFQNIDSTPHWPASNPHPTHDIYPEFDPQQNVDSGTSWSFVFGKVGTWRYHDHLNPTMRGTIVITN